MSDLREFNSVRDDSAPRFVEPSINAPLREDAVIVDDGGLGDLHIRSDVTEEGTGRSKLFAGVAVAVLVGLAGAYGATQYLKDQPVVADNNLPTPSAPTKTAAMTPPPAPASPSPGSRPPSSRRRSARPELRR